MKKIEPLTQRQVEMLQRDSVRSMFQYRTLPHINDVILYRLTDDKRKQPTVLRQLIAEGYAKDGSEILTAKAYDAVVAEKPDLLALLDEHLTRYGADGHEKQDVRRTAFRHGIPTSSLNKEALKWVATRPIDYALSTQHGVGVAAEDFRSRPEAYVSDETYRTRIAALCDALTFRERFVQHLPWGLVEQSLCDEETAKLVQPGRGGPFSGKPLVGEDPEKWPEDIDKACEHLAAKIAKLQSNLARLVPLRDKLHAKGWTQVLAEYETALRQALAEEATKS